MMSNAAVSRETAAFFAVGKSEKGPIVSVGAGIARPPKFKDFGFFAEKQPGFRLAATDFAEQNLRTSDARPYIQV